MSLARSTYHHGDLRDALIAAGLALARVGGPDAVGVREVTRQVGVSPSAAYRHFSDRQALLDAVSAAAQGLAADRMEQELLRVSSGSTGSTGSSGPAGTPASSAPAAPSAARDRLRAVGVGYLAFAREEPGLFRVAFTVPHDLSEAVAPDKAGASGRTPFQLLSLTLDELVAAGSLPASRRPGAELHAWSAVHGLGMLVIDGPLRGLTDEMVDAATVQLLDMVERGL
ncbi:TetR/AcrR family transcriptional regulator [Diaminobutyricimonas sp. TR449]|uniref:TetR/AcrR family transcriptional regulator n=1 Tax=Diaminobutyricimonas sp. TR449 TaxID=2708076 RepID=UPI001423458F|nr:TetR/AcrR family transcriptional regulator [Diaminobutyricimonas sp. TR449]